MDFAAFQHSFFLQALGSAILNSVWQGLIFWFFYKGMAGLYKSSTARMRHNLSIILVFCSFVWFLVSFFSKLLGYKSPNNIGFGIVKGHLNTGNQSISGLDGMFIILKSSLPYLSVAYIFLLFFLSMKLIASYRKVHLISHKGLIYPNPELLSFVNQLRQGMGITRKINLWVSNLIDVPATIGFIKPIILIPLASLNNLSDVQLEAIILHEMSHIKRNDYLTNLLVSIIETVLFFNPFVILLTKVIRQERENCCDDLVLQYNYDAHSYASALLRLARSGAGMLHLGLGAVSGKRQLLLSRIKRITKDKVILTQYNFGQKMLAFIFVTALFCLLAWLTPKGKNLNPASFEKKEKLLPPLSTALSLNGSTNIFSKSKKNYKLIIAGKRYPKNEKDPLESIEKITKENEEITGSLMNGEGLPPELEKVISKTSTNGNPNIESEINIMKRPSSINIKNFPFKEMSLNITLRNLSHEKLNKDLKHVYLKTGGIDLKNVQVTIDKSLFELKNSGLSQKKLSQAYAYEARALAKIYPISTKLFENNALEKVRRQLEIKESDMKLKTDLVTEINKKIQLAFAKLQKNNGESKDGNLNFDFHYDVDENANN
jgi:beta-lactamase regulating signal transducer with metallopeptidase domain